MKAILLVALPVLLAAWVAIIHSRRREARRAAELMALVRARRRKVPVAVGHDRRRDRAARSGHHGACRDGSSCHEQLRVTLRAGRCNQREQDRNCRVVEAPPATLPGTTSISRVLRVSGPIPVNPLSEAPAVPVTLAARDAAGRTTQRTFMVYLR